MHRFELGPRTLSLSVVLVGAIAGCAADEADDPLTSRSGDLLGGTPTLLHEEVGFGSFAGGQCTASLVSPTAFVTAAHCINFAARSAGGSLFLERQTSSGYQSTTLPINDTYALSGQLGGTDLAVGFLSTPPPADWSLGLIMVRYPLPDGLTLTTMGYGCTSRPNGPGVGTKRYVTHTGYLSQLNCPGDSGGPTFQGQLVGKGQLMLVNSAYETPSGNDNNAFMNARWVEGVMRQHDGSMELGMDRPGGDYRSLSTTSLGACAIECRKDKKCTAFSRRRSDGMCFLKGPGLPPTVGDANVDSGLGVGSFLGDLQGSDYTSYHADRFDICEADCGSDSRCAAYTFNAATATCSLKSTIPTTLKSSVVAFSGVRKGFWPETRLLFGVDWQQATTSTAAACASFCSRDTYCDMFTWVPASGLCTLKIGTLGFGPAGAHEVSGFRGGIEYGTDRPGSDYRNFVPGSPATYECQAACASDPACKAWTLTLQPSGAGDRCWLKNAVPAAKASPGMWSGRKGMDFY